MDFINFPLLLVVLVFVSGLGCLYDVLFLRKNRLARLHLIDEQYNGEADREGDAYLRAREQAMLESAPVEYSKSFFPVLAIVLVLRSFIFEPFQIPSQSMVPTLEVGDFIVVNKYTYGLRLPVARTKVLDINQPERGDVMVFFPPHAPDTYYIKRVIGLPGDEVAYINNVLYINGKEQKQTFVANLHDSGGRAVKRTMEDLDGYSHVMHKNVEPSRLSIQFGPKVVPEGHYFMMGDNRDNSSDSRDWGMVPEENIVGKAVAIWMHWETLLSVPSFDRAGSID